MNNKIKGSQKEQEAATTISGGLALACLANALKKENIEKCRKIIGK